ncbi:MAG: hypothetical protein ACI8R4_001952 [Paracoccaceae bacterium]|jgi:hypothetical protein
MASRPQQIDYKGYDTRKFMKIADDLHKTCKFEISRTKGVMSKLDSNGGSFNLHDKNDIKKDIKALEDSKNRFVAVMMSVQAGQKVTVKEIENSYDSYCLALGMLTAHTDMWNTVIASDIVKKTIATIALVKKAHDTVESNRRGMEEDLKALQKVLKKAESSKYKTYFKSALSLALDAAIILSPQVRALSVISKFAVGGLIDVGSNLLVGKPEDFIGTSIGMVNSGTEIEYKARGLTKGADALAKAGKVMKIAGLVGSAGDIKKAHQTVDDINARITKMRKSLVANAKNLVKVGIMLEVAQREIRILLKRLQANAAQADNAEAIYQKFKAQRAGL